MSSVKYITELMESPSDADKALIKRAFIFSEMAHKGHVRKSGEPYFVHLCETAKLLAEFGMGPNAISAGLLHDTIEDTKITAKDIEKEFGPEILSLVEGVTKLGALKYRGVKRHAESLRKLFVATSEDVRVVIIKLADRLHNMKTLEHVAPAKQKRIAVETLEIYARVADRLGMGKLRGELEDLAFPYVYPKQYKKVSILLKQKNKETQKHLEKVHKSLKRALAEQNIMDFESHYRIKHIYSLYKKLERKDWDIDKIHDISALRIIVPTVDDCYKVLGLIHNSWRPLPGKIKDYIAFKKPNGYQSLHTTIFTGDGGIVEIQIRTPEIHREAEYGIASHVSYKEILGNSTKINQNLLWIKSLLPSKTQKKNLDEGEKAGARFVRPDVPPWIKQIAQSESSASESEEFLNILKSDFFTHRVFVFTPEGDVIDLPIDSSPIDFAYAVHSDIGNHISGAKISGKMISLDTKLKNGDIVEIITKKNSGPSQKWLTIAQTTLARRHIRAALQKKKDGEY